MAQPGESRRFEEIEVGESGTSDGRTMTETDVVTYSGLTGNYHPMHTDAEAAEAIGGRVAQGLLVVCIAVQLHIVDNEYAMGYGFDGVRFTDSVHVGDTIRVDWEVVDKEVHSADFGLVRTHAEVVNQDDDVVTVYDLIRLYERVDASTSIQP